MAQQSQVRNPFMLMLQPEVVLAAVERSERLERLNRRLCRPLDRPLVNNGGPAGADTDNDTDDGADQIDHH